MVKRFWTTEKDLRLTEMTDKKLSAKIISALLGCSLSAVYGRSRRLEKRAQRAHNRSQKIEEIKSEFASHPKSERKALILGLLNDGISATVIAEALSVSQQRISRIFCDEKRPKKTQRKARFNMDQTLDFWVYAVRLPINDYEIAYIGFTSNPSVRFYRHCRSVFPIGLAIWACGGADSVVFELLERGQKDAMLIRERELIESHKTYWPFGYNDAILRNVRNMGYRRVVHTISSGMD